MNSSRRDADAWDPVVCRSLRNSLGSAPCAVNQEQISAVAILFAVEYMITAILNAFGIQGSGRQIIVSARFFKKPITRSIVSLLPPTAIVNCPFGITTAGAPLAWIVPPTNAACFSPSRFSTSRAQAGSVPLNPMNVIQEFIAVSALYLPEAAC